MQHKSKKGSLSLSINAIVVLIMAIAMLGVGIFFISNVLDDQLRSPGDISDEVLNQIMVTLRDSGQKMTVLGVGSSLDVQQGRTREITVGLANQLESQLKYNISVERVDDGTRTDSNELTPNLIRDIIYARGTYTLAVGASTGIPMSFQAGSARGTQIYQIVIYEIDEDDKAITYASEQFLVRVQ